MFKSIWTKNGHPEPYQVKYWGVGNENYGEWQVGYRSAKEYAKVLREYAYFMKVVDPNIKIVAVGADKPEWDLEVIKTGMIKNATSKFNYSFPPHSCTVIELNVK